jgi:hypothetical protein
MSHHIIFGSREWPIPERLPAGLVARLSVGDQQGHSLNCWERRGIEPSATGAPLWRMPPSCGAASRSCMASISVDEQISVFTGMPRSWLPEGGEYKPLASG